MEQNGFKKTDEPTKKAVAYRSEKNGKYIYFRPEKSKVGQIRLAIHPGEPVTSFAAIGGVDVNRNEFDHGSNMYRFPKRLNKGINEIHFGIPVKIASIAALTSFADAFHKLSSVVSAETDSMRGKSGSDETTQVSDSRSDDFLSSNRTETDVLPSDGKALEVQSDDRTGQVATYQGDPKKRAVVENYAVAKAIAFFRDKEEFSVDEKGKPYDLHCQRGDLLVHVEVKGTTGFGDKVIVTRNEIKDARNPDWRSDLFIVRNIVLTEDNGEWVASGGKEYRIENWQPHDDDLSATQFEYSVPKTT